MPENEHILFAPLNWGLGHATRCIPLIREEIKKGNKVIIASDGAALDLLKKEFPGLIFENLPAYNIRYSKSAFLLPFSLLMQAPHIMKTIKKENKKTVELIKGYSITKIISDNRYGVYHPDVKSIVITHQLRVLSGIFTPVSTWIQKKLLSKFDEIWVPDYRGKGNLSDRLSHDIKMSQPVKYIGPLSRFQKKQFPMERDILVLLSGPEPQRSLLEEKLVRILAKTGYKTLLIQGKMEKKQKRTVQGKIEIVNFLLGNELEKALQSSRMIISRSGYTSVMDFHKLQVKTLFIPTPGQSEQEYLARYLNKTQYIPFLSQSQLERVLLKKIKTLLQSKKNK